MAIEKPSAPHAHPLTEDYDDTVEAQYACLERPCCCLEGWVFVNYVGVGASTARRGKPLTVPPLRRKPIAP
jgi:hypothetical protein